MGTASLPFDFRTARPGNPLFLHLEFLERVTQYANCSVGKRVALLLQRMLVDESRIFYKTTQGVNRGWRRSRLGGAGGNHFYLWWANAASPVIKSERAFEQAPPDAIFIRDIRHHDDHSELPAHDFQEKYLPVSVSDLRSTDLLPSPFTPEQNRFSKAHSRVRVIKGYPGSGKTTALWHAADQATHHRALYVTFSSDLAALAKDHFEKFAPAEKHFHVTTVPALLADITGGSSAVPHMQVSRERFVKAAGGLPPRTLNVWSQERDALYDEFFGYMVGRALPEAVGRFPASPEPCISGKYYRELRSPVIGKFAADSLCESLALLRRRQETPLWELFSPELALAWRAVQTLKEGKPQDPSLLDFDCIAIDEAQDLTPVEALALVELARLQKPGVTFLAAGDEAQTVRPTDFEWGWFADILNDRLASPADFKLTANLRSPRNIAELVNKCNDLYQLLSKFDRPRGQSSVTIDNDAPEHVMYCSARSGDELTNLFQVLTGREGLAVICVSRDIPDYVPAELRERVFTPTEAKGLDFHSVCLIGAGEFLRWLQLQAPDDNDLVAMHKRVGIDRFRVGLSRPSERLIWLDVNARPDEIEGALRFMDYRSSVLIPDALLQALDEDQLDVEERIRRCIADSIQLMDVKPGLAWARVNQAGTLGVRLLEERDEKALLEEVRRIQVRVALTLGLNRSRLPQEFGKVDLLAEAIRAAYFAYGPDMGSVVDTVARMALSGSNLENYRFGLETVRAFASGIFQFEAKLEPWFVLLLTPHVKPWIGFIERDVEDPKFTKVAMEVLPVLYRVFSVPEAGERMAKHRAASIRALIESKHYQDALDSLPLLPKRDLNAEAKCYEGLGNMRKVAEIHLEAGESKKALAAYRAIPDSRKSLELARKLQDTKAVESLEWLEKLNRVLSNQPDNLMRNLTAAEKDALARATAEWLPTPAARKARTAVKAAAKKAQAKPAAPKKVPAKRPVRRPPTDIEWF